MAIIYNGYIRVDTLNETEQRTLFEAFDCILSHWTRGIAGSIVADRLDDALLARVTNRIGRTGYATAHLFLNPRDHSSASLSADPRVIVSLAVPEGTVYACTEGKHMGLVESGSGYHIAAVMAVASATVRGTPPPVHDPDRTDDNLRNIFG